MNEGFYLEASVETKPEHTAKEIQHEWGGSLSEIGGEEYDKDEKKKSETWPSTYSQKQTIGMNYYSEE